MTKPFRIDLLVRDYECDIQGIVNNAVYLNYLEVARHEYLKANGINFIDMHKQGKDLVIIRAEIDYKQSLIADDEFYILNTFTRESRIKFAFHQEILRKTDDKTMLKAKMIGTCVSHGKPVASPELEDLV